MAVDVRSPLFILGALLAVMSFGMLWPAVAEWIDGGPDGAVFAACFFITVFAGVMLMLGFRPRAKLSLNIHQAFLLTAAAWVVLTMFAALPFSLGSLHLSYVDAYFETMSGVTTTGSTVIAGLDKAPSGILWWRSLLQWFGGVGIIVMAVAVLPFLRIGGMQLFRTESSDRSEKILPRVQQISVAILIFYGLASLLSTLALWAVGLSFFDAANHTMAAIATGGFSTHDASVAALANPAAEWILTATMFVGGSTLLVLIQSWTTRKWLFVRDTQMQAYTAICLVCAAGLATWHVATNGAPVLTALRHALFSVVTIVTTTGFAADDYTKWGNFPIVLIFFLTFVGACTGSTAGGIKIFRFQILYQLARIQLLRLTHPNAVIVPTFNGREISREVINSVAGFVFLYFFSFVVLSIGLSLFGLDLDTSLSGAATALGNVGPGVGDIIGPSGNFATLPDGAKWLLSFGMLLGRLELLTLLVLLMPSFWRA